MKLLANENIPLTSVYVLRQAGFDITAISELSPGISDAQVLSLAEAELRGLPYPPGLVYMRFLPATPTVHHTLDEIVCVKKNIVQGFFMVLDRDSVRRRALPAHTDISK